jgi:hypothetical protein
MVRRNWATHTVHKFMVRCKRATRTQLSTVRRNLATHGSTALWYAVIRLQILKSMVGLLGLHVRSSMVRRNRATHQQLPLPRVTDTSTVTRVTEHRLTSGVL